MKGLVAAVAALAVASASGDEFLVKREFLDAIRFVESSDGRYLGDQDGGRSHGPYQISEAYLQDANEYLGTDYTIPQVIGDDAVAVAVMCGYWNRYLPRDREVTYEILARIHNGGPRWHEKESTIRYWEKVKAKMEELENANQDQAGRD